ncbi:MAG: hypothetical protein FWF36_08050 [Propionibacteriaceae bacterium]|nr:hypothetical protein [Propionibacteriaceae bacterium]
MIIFSGWGILAIVPPGIGYGLGMLLGVAIGGESSTKAFVIASIGLMIGSVGDWYLGNWFNKIRPAAQMDQAVAARRQQLQQLVSSGQYYRGPGYPMPTSMQDAQNQADAQLAAEAAGAHARIGNRHTLFFIPMQYWAYIGAGLGAVLLIVYLFFQ